MGLTLGSDHNIIFISLFLNVHISLLLNVQHIHFDYKRSEFLRSYNSQEFTMDGQGWQWVNYKSTLLICQKYFWAKLHLIKWSGILMPSGWFWWSLLECTSVSSPQYYLLEGLFKISLISLHFYWPFKLPVLKHILGGKIQYHSCFYPKNYTVLIMVKSVSTTM